jgi:phage terminase Nu1 subunit (DNA packaging protein)
MPKAGKKLAPDSTVLVSASELAEIIGADFETVNNWVRRGIISRAPIGGRQLRARLFSTEEVYKAALTNELVRLGIQPSSASEAANSI